MRTPQEIRDYLLILLKEKKISANKMLNDCGCNASLVNDLKKGQMPSADKIANIAKYLGISTDNLMGNELAEELNQTSKTTELEKDFIADLRQALYGTSYRQLNENDIKNIVELAKVITKIKN